jgi:hypothetical protein
MDRAGLVIALVALAGAALAHEEKFPKRDRLELRPDGARVVLDYAIPAGDDARALREIFDRDHSGSLDERERVQLVEYLALQASHFVELRVDGRRVALARSALEPDPIGGGTARLGVRVVLTATTPITRSVQFSDRHKDRRITVPVEIVPAGGLTIASALTPQPFVFAEHPVEFTVACESCKKM